MALRIARLMGVPDVHHSDHGIDFAAQDYVEQLGQYRMRMSMARLGRPKENGFVERLMRAINEEEVNHPEYQGAADARGQMGRFLEVLYMTQRISPALDYPTPCEFEAAWRRQRIPQYS